MERMHWSLIIGFVTLFRPILGETCSELELFRCHNDQCINEFLVCNNVKDCEDGSDEREYLCSVVERTKKLDICPKDGPFFSCMGVPCLPVYRVCDHINDCIYGTDESISVCGKRRYAKSVPQHHSGSGASGDEPYHTSSTLKPSPTVKATAHLGSSTKTMLKSHSGLISPSATPDTNGQKISVPVAASTRIIVGTVVGVGVPGLVITSILITAWFLWRRYQSIDLQK